MSRDKASRKPDRPYSSSDLRHLIAQGCSRKGGYTSWRRAKAAVKVLKRKWGVAYRIYGPCSFCREFHLTKAKRVRG